MIWVKQTEPAYVNYVDAGGKHYVPDWCHKICSRIISSGRATLKIASPTHLIAQWISCARTILLGR